MQQTGRSVMGDAGKEVYLIRNRTKCTFGSYELFLKMGFTDRVRINHFNNTYYYI